MEFRFKSSSCVSVGTFNIYILQPKYLAEMGVIEPGHDIQLSADLSQPGIRFRMGSGVWIVRPERLTVESAESSFDCGEFVGKALEALPWTPVMAVGINATFVADADAESEFPKRLRLPELPSEYQSDQRTMQFAIRRDDHVMNFQFAARDEDIQLSLNIHADFKSLTKKPTEVSSAASSFCRKFKDHRDSAIQIVKHIIGADFRDAEHHTESPE